MFHQGAFQFELLLALGTGQQLLLALVRLHVQLQTDGVHKALFADIARDGLLNQVRSQMDHQTAGLGERLVALVALVRLLTSVDT